MKKILLLASFVMLFFAGTSYAEKKIVKEGEVTKAKVEASSDMQAAGVAVLAKETKVTVKEHLKVEDPEYIGSVASKSNINDLASAYGLGVIALAAIGVFLWLFRKLSANNKNVVGRLSLASLVLFLASVFAKPLMFGAMVLAGVIMLFPSLKRFSILRTRLMVGETEDPEVLAIKEITKQVTTFKDLLGEKLSKTDFQATTEELKALKEGLKDWSGEKIETSLKTINDAIAKYGKQLEELQEAANVAKESKGARKVGEFVATKDVEDFVKQTFDGSQKTNNKAAIKLNGGMVFKAAEVFGIPTFFEGAAGTVVDAFTGRFIDPTLYQRKRKRNLIIDHFPIETISVPKLIYLEKIETSGVDNSSEDSGGADWITSGEQKPMRSFRVTTGSVEAKKVAIFGTVEDKLLKDVPSLENWIREDFFDEIREKYNDGLLNNNPSVDEDAPLGLKQNAIQYAATPAFDGTIAAPTYIDMIVAAAAYMDSLKEEPGKAFVAGDVWYAIHILKDNDARYQNNQMVYVNSLGQLFIAGVEIVKADAEDVPSTHLLMTSVDVGFKIKNYGPLVFERGLNGTDFREDKTSFRGYQEVLSYIATHRFNSVLYDTWANIEAAITAGS